MPTALISVSDKQGIVELAQALESLDFDIISTGGTFRTLEKAGIKNLKDIAEFTGFPEGLDGRVKTLTPQVFGGILNLRDNPDHQKFCEANQITSLDLVVVNLYPFKETYEDPAKSFEEKLEQIDIGGPSMIRAAAKNYAFCAPVVDPKDYPEVIKQYREKDDLNTEFRKTLAAKVFEMTAHYDLLIAKFWVENSSKNILRYGENPHQTAVVLNDPFYKAANLIEAKVLNGKPLSFNNFNDAHGALELVFSFDRPFCTIVKHATPCGASVGKNVEEAFDRALETDPVSAFGGIIAVNREVTKSLAEKIIGFFNEVVIAPSYATGALEVLKAKKNLRVIEIPHFEERLCDTSVRGIRGGTLMQDLDVKKITAEDLKTVTQKNPTPQQIADLITAWKLVKIVKSNAIVIVKDGQMIGKGGGQTSRVEAMDIALRQAGSNTQGAVVASDAFFPFPDSVEKAGEHKIAAIIQPGGSIKDDEVIAEADKQGLTMVFTGIRAFLH